jgi:hypothetical protein
MNRLVARWLGLFGLVAVVVGGCKGGEGATAPPPPSSGAMLSGTAAHGAPIANAAVTVKDRTGATRTGTTGANGQYSVDVSGLTAPLLVRVDPTGGASLYSVAAAAPGVANVHPYSDLSISLWYQVQGKTTATAFASPQANPAPGAAGLPILSGIVEGVLAKWLTDAGLAASFDPLTSPFDANGTGFDRVLAQSTVNAGTGTVTIVDNPSSPTVTQTTTFAVNTASSSVTVTTTTSAGGSSSSSVVTTVVPSSSAAQTALAGATATLSALAAIVNTKGAALTAADLASLFDASFLLSGEDAAIGEADFATVLRGSTINSITLDQILSYDDAAKVISVSGTASITQPGGATQLERLDVRGAGLGFRQQGAGPAWVLYGNQRPVFGELSVRWTTDVGPGGTTQGADVGAGMQAPTGDFTGLTISGGGIFNNAPIPKSPAVRVETFYPTPTTTIQVLLDQFDDDLILNALPPAGTVFTFTLTPATGSPTSFTLTSPATTTEPMFLTSPMGTTLADAKLGQPLAVTWSLPRTFPVAEVRFSGKVTVSGFSCPVDGQLNASRTGGTITLPPTCQGQPAVGALIGVAAVGPNGEQTGASHGFQ